MSVRTWVRYAWAAPASAVGLVLAAPAVLLNMAHIARHDGALEITLRNRSRPIRAVLDKLPFAAITFGHVVVAVSPQAQRLLRSHERVHVAQYERLGPLFLLAYPAESLLQWLRGRRPYVDNRFEVEARRLSRPRAAQDA